jgi:hypothetical protein
VDGGRKLKHTVLVSVLFEVGQWEGFGYFIPTDV